MRLIFYSFLSIFFGLFAACSKQDSPETPEPPEDPDNTDRIEEVYFTLNVNPTYDTESTDNYIFVHDEEGVLLEYRAFETGDTLAFQAEAASIPPFYTVTRFTVNPTQSGTTYDFSSVTQTPKGTVLDYGGPLREFVPPPQPVRLEDFTITITGVPEPPKIMVCSKIGMVAGSGSGRGYGGLWTYDIQVTRFEGADEYVVSIIDGHNSYQYYYLNNPAGEDISLEYPFDFKNFDRELEVDLPPHSSYNAHTSGFYSGETIGQWDGIWMQDLFSSIDDEVRTDPLKVVYLDRFDKFRTYFSITMDGYAYYKNSFGPAFTDLTIPDKPVIEVQDPTLRSFRFTTDQPFKEVSWSFSKSSGVSATPEFRETRWSVSAKNGYQQIIGDIPMEVIEQYPEMDLNGMQFGGIRLFMERGEGFLSTTESIAINPI